MIRLGVNIDHVATLRQARRGQSPDPVTAALVCELAGAHSIVCHLREDRRHIEERDVRLLRQQVKTALNLEIGLNMLPYALEIKPDRVTLVPERRDELTTEGGLDLSTPGLASAIERLGSAGIEVSLFIDPSLDAVQQAKALGADWVELHTGAYAQAKGIRLAAGHGLHLNNLPPITGLAGLEEVNIGYHLIGRALFVGLSESVREFLALLH